MLDSYGFCSTDLEGTWNKEQQEHNRGLVSKEPQNKSLENAGVMPRKKQEMVTKETGKQTETDDSNTKSGTRSGYKEGEKVKET